MGLSPPPPPPHERVGASPQALPPPGHSVVGEHCGACVWLLMAIFSRTLNGLGILVCSMDGSVAFLDFSQDELGDPLSEEEKVGARPRRL